MKIIAVITTITINAFLAIQVVGHSYMLQPVPRTAGFFEDPNNRFGCPPGGNKGASRTSFTAGETIDISYWRNNHIGGFVRYSLIPANLVESRENFDANVFYYHCREILGSCEPVGLPYSRFEAAYDNAGGDNRLTCRGKITLPNWLPAGDYTLQWTYYGAGHSYGNSGEANPTYRSCHDIRLTTSGQGQKPACPGFQGGDRATKFENRPSNQCLYFHETGIPSAIFKVPNSQAAAEYKFGVPLQVSQCSANRPTSTQTVWVTSTYFTTKTASC